VLKAQADNVLVFKDPDRRLPDIQTALDNFSTAVHMLNRTRGHQSTKTTCAWC